MAQCPVTITINDGTATPVAITFTAVKASPTLTVFKDKRLAKPAHWPEITLSADLPAGSAVLRKFEARVAWPVVDVITGKVTDTGRVRVLGDIPMSMAQSDVKHLYAFAMNAMGHALLRAAMQDLDTVIG